jgi:MoaA/NifB/PqqE/SkfB family radical SAM enzyme
MKLDRPTRLLKLYIEPTNQCNLECRTCIRHSWNEPPGMMSEKVFDRIMDGLSTFSPLPTVSFGGFGEPLSHPKIVEMITRVKALGASIELITNATLLMADLSQKLVRIGLDVLWVSIDGASTDSYADIRLGATLPQVLENLAHFRDSLHTKVVTSPCVVMSPSSKTALGIAFVAMKRNIADLPAVLRLAQKFEAKHFLVTNILPYTEEMCKEVLYNHTLSETGTVPSLSMPLIDIIDITRDPLYWAMRHSKTLTWAGNNLRSARDHCPFIENGIGAIRWDGGFSPCLPLLHSHIGFVQDRARFSRRWIVGNVTEKSLPDIWNAPEHIAFRDRVHTFDFPPCTSCGGCEVSEANEEDCFDNVFPTCGGCLWAQGIVQCP